MLYLFLAYLTAALHFTFVAFVIAGGLLSLWWPKAVLLHIPVAVYGVLIMVVNWRCPLTELEIWLRRMAGETVEWTGFLNHYLLSRFGLDGSEWFVLVSMVALILLCNFRVYWRFFIAG